jgi:hypothetical protein
MEPVTIVRIVSGVLLVIVSAVLIHRRRARVR